MAKNRSWFSLVKRFFISYTHSKPGKKEKRRKWMFGRIKVKRLASIAAPSPTKDRSLTEAEEEQGKNALTVAIVTAAAAEAAVAAAHVATEVVRLAGIPQATHECGREIEDLAIEIKTDVPQYTNQCEREILELAAIRIQSTFRGYLARKALGALKGIVKLQAIIRGRNVRRQAITTLKCLQSIVNIQSQVCTRYQMAGGWHHDENKQLQTWEDKIIKMDSNCRRWDDSILTKQEADAIFLSKKEAFIKRERIKEYWFSHRKSVDSEQNKVNGRWRYCLEQWVDTQVRKSKEVEDLDTVWTSNAKPGEEYRRKGLRLKNLQRQYNNDGLDSQVLVPGRLFHRKQISLGGEKSFVSSTVVPTYMAATESAKAKSRSPSSPKLKPWSFDTYSDSYSPCKNKLSLISSIASEAPSFGGITSRPSAYQQRYPRLKTVPGPIKSSRTAKDLSFDSECSSLN